MVWEAFTRLSENDLVVNFNSPCAVWSVEGFWAILSQGDCAPATKSKLHKMKKVSNSLFIVIYVLIEFFIL
jgi:hypothetical protein